MTRIKLCGLKREFDILWANELAPDYIGFVFVETSKRYVDFDKAMELRSVLDKNIISVGVFADEAPNRIAELVNRGVIGTVQLHGSEDNEYISVLRSYVDCPIIKAFRVSSTADINEAEKSRADFVMFDSGGGTGKAFDHSLIKSFNRDFFLAGGIDAENVRNCIEKYRPYAVDVSSALETDGVKDKGKMIRFVQEARKGD